jgi:hypothetical protein
MPHPKGEIKLDLQHTGANLTVDADLPPATPGDFLYKGLHHPLTEGHNHLIIHY